MIWLLLEAFIITNSVGSNTIVTFLGVLVSSVSLFAIHFGGYTVGGLELVSATSCLLVVCVSCGGVLRGNVSIPVSIPLAASVT